MHSLALLLCLAAASAGPPATDEGKPVETKTSMWNVLDFGALPDGAGDNTAAFQKALDTAGSAKGGIVHAPAGRYRFDGSLRIPLGVTLRGVFAYAPSHTGIRDKGRPLPEYGTVLLPHAGAGSEEGAPFVTIGENATLQGVCIHYPEQQPDAAQPTPYPYTVALRENNPALLDCELLNPYNAIDASRNQRALVRNVHGQPIHIGVYVDLIYDIGRIENVHWNPWWSYETPVFKWQMEHGVGFLFGKTDWHYVLNTFCFGYHVGYQFVETEAGGTNGNFLGIGADRCMTAVLVEESAPMGILITNGEFVAFDPPEPVMLRVAATHSGVVRFVNCAFWGPSHRIAQIEGTGTIGLSDCTFMQWGHHGGTPHAIRAEGGSVLIRGCEFKEDKPQVYLGKDVARAIVSENLVKGQVRIENHAEARAITASNLGTPE